MTPQQKEDQIQATKEKLQKQYNCPIWRTQDDQLIPFTIMAERHIRASIRHKRKQVVLLEAAYVKPISPYATAYSTAEYAGYLLDSEDAFWADIRPPADPEMDKINRVKRTIDALQNELERRQLAKEP